MPYKVIDSCPNAEEDVQNASNPDKLLCESASEGEVCPRQNQGDGEDKNK